MNSARALVLSSVNRLIHWTWDQVMTSVLANTKLQTEALQRDLSIIYPPIRRKPEAATFTQTWSHITCMFQCDSIMSDENLSEVMAQSVKESAPSLCSLGFKLHTLPNTFFHIVDLLMYQLTPLFSQLELNIDHLPIEKRKKTLM